MSRSNNLKSLADWVRAGVYHESVLYDWRITHDFFRTKPQHCTNSSIPARVNILMLGDSVDRNLLDDGCELALGGWMSMWGDELSYMHAGRKWVQAGAFCEGTNNLSWAYMNVYGSKQKGPYYQNFHNNPADPYTDTESRIFETVRQYRLKFGEPTYIFYRADLWDLHVVAASNFSRAETELYFTQYRENLQWAWSLLRRLSPLAMLCTHTIPLILWEHSEQLFDDFMSSLRYVATINDVTIFDWNQMLGRSDPHTYLRDKHHPDSHHSSSFARLVTSALLSWSCQESTRPRFDLGGKVITSNNSSFFYVDAESGIRHALHVAANDSGLPSYLKFCEVVLLSSAQLDETTCSSPNSSIPFIPDGSLIRMASEKTVYIVQNGQKCPIHDSRIFAAHGWSFENVQVFSSKYPMHLIPLGQELSL